MGPCCAGAGDALSCPSQHLLLLQGLEGPGEAGEGTGPEGRRGLLASLPLDAVSVSLPSQRQALGWPPQEEEGGALTLAQ